MGFVWALAFVLVGAPVGVTAALQWGKIRTTEIKLQQSRVNNAAEEKHQAFLDNDLKRRERELELTLASSPETMALVAAEKEEQAAAKRLKAAELDAKSKVIAATLQDQAAAEREIIIARKQAAINALDEWLASQPEVTLPNPFEGIPWQKMYEDHQHHCRMQSIAVPTFNKWLGNSPQVIAKAFASIYKHD